MKKTIPSVILISIASLAIFWLPFLLKLGLFWGIDFGRQGLNVIVQNFDGLNFLVVAKSLYNPAIIEEINRSFMTGNTPIYFSAHFPLMAIMIRLFSMVMSMPNALLVTIILSNVLLAYGLYVFFNTFVQKKNYVWILTIIALFFPARILSVRAVGSNEPLFIFLVLMSIVAAYQKRDWRAGLYGALAVLTRSPGILLFGAYGLAILLEKNSWMEKFKRIAPYLLMPTTLLGLFVYYGLSYGDLFAYFNSGDNLHLFFPPFSIFSNVQSWISDMWREDLVYLYLFYAAGILLVDSKYSVIKMFSWIYGATLLMVAHRDLARYSLPLAPIVILGYERIITQIPGRYLKLSLILLIPIYLLGWQFVLKNIQPINDWSIFIAH